MKLTITPSWMRWVLILLSGGLAALSALHLMNILLASGQPGLFPFVPILISFMLNGSICIFSIQQEGPLKALLYASGSLLTLSAVFGFLALLISPASPAPGAYAQQLGSMGVAVAIFWTAMSCIKPRQNAAHSSRLSQSP